MPAPGAAQPSIRTVPSPSGRQGHHGGQRIAGEGDGANRLRGGAAGAGGRQVQLSQGRHLGVQGIQGELELDPVHQSIGNRIAFVVVGAQLS